MKEHEHRYVEVIEKHALNGVNTVTSMKYKNMYVTLVKSTRMSGANTVAMMFSIAA